MLRISLIALFAVAAQAVITFPVCPEPSQLICDGVDMSKPNNAQDMNNVPYTTFPLFQGPSGLPDIINFQCIGETLYCGSSNGPVDCNTDTFAPLYKCRCAPVSSICGPDKSLPFCVGDNVYCSTNSAQLGIPITSATPLAPTSLCPNVTATAQLDASLKTTAGSAPSCQPISNNGLVIEPGAAGASIGGKRSCSLLDFSYTINGVDNSRIVSQVSFDYKCPSTGNKWRNFQAVRDGHSWSPTTEGFFGLFGKPCFLRRENTAVETMLKATVDTGAIELAEASLTSADGSEVTTLKFLCTQSIFN